MKVINYQGTEIKLTSMRQGVAYPWDGKYQKEYHRVNVTINGVRIQFAYYCNESKLEPNDLLNAFYCFLSDGIAYKNAQDFRDFCEDFGYEVYNDAGRYNAQSKKVYQGCARAYEKWSQFGIDIYDICNWLQETYDL